MTTWTTVLVELDKYRELSQLFDKTKDWNVRKALVVQESVFLLHALEFAKEYPELLTSLSVMRYFNEFIQKS